MAEPRKTIDGFAAHSNTCEPGLIAAMTNRAAMGRRLDAGSGTARPAPINFDLDAVGVVSFDGNGNANGPLVVNLGGPGQSPQINTSQRLTA